MTDNGQVQRLNQTNQLGAEVSIALPVHFAQKLARRVFQYFHFYATDSASIVPEILVPAYNEDRKQGYRVNRLMKSCIEAKVYKDLDESAEFEFGTGPATEDAQQAHQNGTLNAAPMKGKNAEPTEDEMAELNEQEEVHDANSIASPWHPNVRDKMFYL